MKNEGTEVMTIHNFDVKKAAITEYLTLSQKRYLVMKGIDSVFEIVNGITVCDMFTKDIFLTMVLLGSYFGCKLSEHEVGDGVISTFDESEYDFVHENDLLGMIERTKFHKEKDSSIPTELSKKVRRATEDYALFTKFFNTAINNELSVRNNLVDRLVDRMATDLTPENMQKAQAELTDLGERIKQAHEKTGVNPDEIAAEE